MTDMNEKFLKEISDLFPKSLYAVRDMYRTLIRDKVLHAVNTDELDHIFETDGFFDET